ncbi:MAG: hypothetical protein M0033_10070 [Nitrospiraceae bacterium]|nr:hypothetical protein [Nitrospiraceae bacterium]
MEPEQVFDDFVFKRLHIYRAAAQDWCSMTLNLSGVQADLELICNLSLRRLEEAVRLLGYRRCGLLNEDQFNQCIAGLYGPDFVI